MYEKFFGLREKPFNVTSDPSFFYLSRRHREAFSFLVYGISERKGIIEITGEIGTGKTTLCRTLLNHLDKKTKTAFILNPNFSEVQFLQAVVEDFGIATKTKSRLGLVQALNIFLLEESKAGRNIVLIIDEAQNLKPNQLEQIRLLSNLETEKEKLLQIILVGQPELHGKLKLPQLRQIAQRISVRYHILPLDRDELETYINHRLKIAGANGTLKFLSESFDAIFSFSKGVPRLINMLCDRALLACFVKEAKEISPEIVEKCIEELE
ncbi:MAG: AAA family ATPase [Candidatus Omnitrophota bacterium]